MSILKDFWDFISDKNKIHQLLFILPTFTFYVTHQADWLFFLALIILAIMEVYRRDIENKVPIFMNNRLKQMQKNKPLLRNWKDQLKDAGKEFNYIYAWPIFGLVSLIFIVEFVYSAYISFSYSKILFGVHLFLAAFMIFLDLIIAHNFELLSKKKRKK